MDRRFVKVPLTKTLGKALEAWYWARFDGRRMPTLPMYRGHPIALDRDGYPIFRLDIDGVAASWAVIGPMPAENAQTIATKVRGNVLKRAPQAVGVHTDG